MKQANQFKNLLKKLNKIDKINSGGCGLTALAIYNYLLINKEKKSTTKFYFLYAGWEYESYKNNKRLLTNNNSNNKHCLDVPRVT